MSKLLFYKVMNPREKTRPYMHMCHITFFSDNDCGEQYYTLQFLFLVVHTTRSVIKRSMGHIAYPSIAYPLVVYITLHNPLKQILCRS